MSAIERVIAAELVNRALGHGWTVSVNDGEEWTLKRSRDYTAIMEALCTTDSDTLWFRDASGKRVGSVWLIWGNDCDLISDHTDNAAMYALTDGLDESLQA